LLALALLLQIAHRERAALADVPVIGAPIAQFYAALGRPIEPSWDVRAYTVRQLGAATDERPDFSPCVRVCVTLPRGRSPHHYCVCDYSISKGAPSRNEIFYRANMRATTRCCSRLGDALEAELSALDPGPRVVGFEIDACLPRADRAPVCSADGIASGARAP
jgi:hypothetical protein